MPQTYFQEFTRDDGTKITVEYIATGGSPAHFAGRYEDSTPAEAPEIEIVKAWRKGGDEDDVTLTDAEIQKFGDWIAEHHEGDDGSDDYFD